MQFIFPGPGAGYPIQSNHEKSDFQLVPPTPSKGKMAGAHSGRSFLLTIPEKSDSSVLAIIYSVHSQFHSSKIKENTLTEFQAKYFQTFQHRTSCSGQYYTDEQPSERLRKLVHHLKPQRNQMLIDESRAIHDTVFAIVFDGQKLNEKLVSETSPLCYTTKDKHFYIALNPKISSRLMRNLQQKIDNFNEKEIDLTAPPIPEKIIVEKPQVIEKNEQLKKKRTNLLKRYWSPEQDQKLLDLMNKYKSKTSNSTSYLCELEKIDPEFAKLARLRMRNLKEEGSVIIEKDKYTFSKSYKPLKKEDCLLDPVQFPEVFSQKGTKRKLVLWSQLEVNKLVLHLNLGSKIEVMMQEIGRTEQECREKIAEYQKTYPYLGKSPELGPREETEVSQPASKRQKTSHPTFVAAAVVVDTAGLTSTETFRGAGSGSGSDDDTSTHASMPELSDASSVASSMDFKDDEKDGLLMLLNATKSK